MKTMAVISSPMQVEKLFRQSAEFASEHAAWRLNLAHVFFMQVRYHNELA